MNLKYPQSRLAEHLTKPVIPYLAEPVNDFFAEVISHASVVMVQVDELENLATAMEPFRRPPLQNVPVLLHLDLIRGLARDEAAVRFVAGFVRIQGIITVHHHLIPTARRLGLATVVRLFLQDGRAVNRGVAVVEKSKPDAVELLPGVAAIEAAKDFESLPVPRIAGGLIRGPETLHRVIQSGFLAVSTTNHQLWSMNTP